MKGFMAAGTLRLAGMRSLRLNAVLLTSHSQHIRVIMMA